MTEYFWGIIRGDGSSNKYSAIVKMLRDFDRHDLETLWKLVKDKYGNVRPEDEYDRVLWGDLKFTFEPDIAGHVWASMQREKLFHWKMYESCGVHFIRFESVYFFMLIEKKYPLPTVVLTSMLNKKLQCDHPNDMVLNLVKSIVMQLKTQ